MAPTENPLLSFDPFRTSVIVAPSGTGKSRLAQARPELYQDADLVVEVNNAYCATTKALAPMFGSEWWMAADEIAFNYKDSLLYEAIKSALARTSVDGTILCTAELTAVTMCVLSGDLTPDKVCVWIPSATRLTRQQEERRRLRRPSDPLQPVLSYEQNSNTIKWFERVARRYGFRVNRGHNGGLSKK